MKIKKLVQNFFCCGCHPPGAPVRIHVSIDAPVPKEGKMPAEATCDTTEKVLVHYSFSKKGKPVPVQLPIEVSVQSGTGTSEVQPDGTSFFAISGDDPGSTVYVVSVDANTDPGVTQNISDTFILNVEGLLADTFGAAVDGPIPK